MMCLEMVFHGIRVVPLGGTLRSQTCRRPADLKTDKTPAGKNLERETHRDPMLMTDGMKDGLTEILETDVANLSLLWSHRDPILGHIFVQDTPRAFMGLHNSSWRSKRDWDRTSVVSSLAMFRIALHSKLDQVTRGHFLDNIKIGEHSAVKHRKICHGQDVRRLYIATEQYSSFCASAVVLTLGGDDMEDSVPDREQVDREREKVEVGDKQERETKTKRQQTHAQTCDIMDGMWME